MLIENGKLRSDSLAGHIAVVTGAGRGIGFQTARALLCLGANVVIAEIDPDLATSAETELTKEFDPDRVLAVQTDVGDEADVARMSETAIARFGRVDIVINNATVTPMGAVWDVPIDQWDYSYRVNLRGPVLLAQQFIPGMLKRNHGVFVSVSSVGEAYMGAYESFKAAQVHLANTLDAELENTEVCAFTIGPGLVRTPGADAGIWQLAPLYNKTVEEFYDMSRDHIISAEEAGMGFAASVVLASQFRGQEINSKQALVSAGISPSRIPTNGDNPAALTDPVAALTLCRRVAGTLKEQSEGWSRRPLFERQWMFRDFKKHAGMAVEQWLKALSTLESALEDEDWDTIHEQDVPIQTLADYYEHLITLASGYEKDPVGLKEQTLLMREWINEANSLAALLD